MVLEKSLKRALSEWIRSYLLSRNGQGTYGLPAKTHTTVFIREHIPNTHLAKKENGQYQTNCHSAYGN